MILAQTTMDIFEQLAALSSRMSRSDFSKPLDQLNGNSVGMHMRHIIEFYDCLVRGYVAGLVNYDKRAHDTGCENDPVAAVHEMERIARLIPVLGDKPLALEAGYAGEEDFVSVMSSFNRELIYNIEHAIHHMAIIRIAAEAAFPLISLPDDFGVAYSTKRFREKKACAQ